MTVPGNTQIDGYTAQASDSPHGADRIVHVVDDMGDQLVFMKRHLERSGYKTELHSSFDQLQNAMAARDANAIFLDVRLGPVDAIDVLKFLAGKSSKANIFLMSGDAAALDIARRYAEEVGISVADCLVKPFSGVRVVECVGGGQDLSARSTGFDTLDIEKSLARGWLYPVFQPKLDLRTGRIESAELLSRIAHPDFENISIHEFIVGLTQAQRQALFLGNIRYVMEQFLESAPNLRVNINVDLANIINQRDALNALRRLSPGLFENLVFEITEEVLCEIDEDGLKALYKLCMDGATLSIDDFGIGQSGFARLARLPFSEVKIDRSIVNGCSQSQARRVLISSIIAMTHNLGARVIAEGVEEPEDLAFLERARCDEVQGYLVARPMRLEKLVPFVNEFNLTFVERFEDEPSEAIASIVSKDDDGNDVLS